MQIFGNKKTVPTPVNKKHIVYDMVVRAKQNPVVQKKQKFVFSKKNKIIIFASIFLTVLLFTIVQLPKAKADSKIFYPKNCLGGWQNPQAVQDKPETSDEYIPEDFTESNSAVLKNTISQLFCGGFEGEIPEKTVPTKIVLRPIWSVEDGSIIHPIGDAVQILEPDTDTNSETGNTEVINTEITPNEIIPTGDLLDIESDPVSFLGIPIAYAQEADVPVTTVEVISENNIPDEVSVTTETEKETTIVNVSDENKETVSDISQVPDLQDNSMENETINAPVELLPVSEPIMRISYTLDGTNWIVLSDIHRTDWKNKSFEIPLIGWSDLSKFQVSVESLSTIDASPTIYLDAIGLEISYAELIVDENSDPKKLHVDKVNNEKSTLDFRVLHDPDQGEIIIISGPQETELHFYKNDDPSFLINSALGKGEVVFPTYQFDPGDFTLIETIGTDACINQTLDKCRLSSEYEGETLFTLIKP